MSQFDKDSFARCAADFRLRLQTDELVASQVRRAMTLLGEAAISLVAFSRDTSGGGPLLTARVSEAAVQIHGGNRHLLFCPTEGTAADYRLPHPRSEICGQIFVFGHLSGQDESILISSFRVYADALCTDGLASWSLDDGSESYLPYLSQLIKAGIFEQEICWPDLEALPAALTKVPLSGDYPDESALRKPCFLFECNLPPRTSKG